ncbi:haloacid dehalogenase [Actinospongicola halichondriae]|uniref:haloacid dehalogenase n=1 Tax=Actinospongicola halichondriae TaxID=3236844 RepID=UPI003D4A8047
MRRDRLDAVVDDIRSELGDAHRAREAALPACRLTIRHASLAIRAVHRGDRAVHDSELEACERCLREAQDAVADQAMVRHAGFLHDAEKEYAEARLTAALVAGDDIPSHTDIDVMAHSWMRGLAEAASELRRNVLDRLRADDLDAAQELLGAMDDAYDVLASVDLPDALTGGLRRSVDSLRAVTERTRGDVTTTILQTRLRRAIEGRSAAGESSSVETDT